MFVMVRAADRMNVVFTDAIWTDSWSGENQRDRSPEHRKTYDIDMVRVKGSGASRSWEARVIRGVISDVLPSDTEG